MVVGESINQLDEAAAFGEKSQEHQSYSKAEVETDDMKQMSKVFTTVPPRRSTTNKTNDSFVANCFSVQRQQNLDPLQKFRCRDLTVRWSGVRASSISDDETLLASCGRGPDRSSLASEQSCERWTQCQHRSIEIEGRHESRVCCLALSSDNERLFSGDSLGQVFIHDVAM